MSGHNGGRWLDRACEAATVGMRTRVGFFWETMVKGEQLLQQQGRGRQKGGVDACKHLYIQHASTDALWSDITAAIHHALENETKALRAEAFDSCVSVEQTWSCIVWDQMCGRFIDLSDTDLSLAMTSLYCKYSRNEVMSRHSMSRQKVRAFGMWNWSMEPTLTHEHTCRIYIEDGVRATRTHHKHAITQHMNTRPVHLLSSVQGISRLHITSSTYYPISLFERKPLWRFKDSSRCRWAVSL